MTAVVEFVSPAERALEDAERVLELVANLDGLNARLASLEKSLAECAGANPLAAVLERLDAMENKVAALELRQRRPVPLTVHQTGRLDPDDRALFNELQRIVNRLDRDLNARMAALDARFSRVATRAYRARKAAAAEGKGV